MHVMADRLCPGDELLGAATSRRCGIDRDATTTRRVARIAFCIAPGCDPAGTSGCASGAFVCDDFEGGISGLTLSE